MSSKEIAIEVIQKLPDEASLLDIAHELEFVAGIREGAEQLDRGEFLTAEQILEQIPRWAAATR
jgi:predicted transcriptional regulator